MENRMYEYSELAKYLYGYSGSFSHDTAVNYGHALLCIAGADGEVSEEEMNWLINIHANVIGFPKEIITAWKSFNYKGTKLEEVIGKLKGIPVNMTYALIYDAVKMSSADMLYANREKAAVFQAAELLGIDKKTVLFLECLVDNEKMVQRNLAILFEPLKTKS